MKLSHFREELEKKYKENLKNELAIMEERHKKELQLAKRQQWCWQCEKEVRFF